MWDISFGASFFVLSHFSPSQVMTLCPSVTAPFPAGAEWPGHFPPLSRILWRRRGLRRPSSDPRWQLNSPSTNSTCVARMKKVAKALCSNGAVVLIFSGDGLVCKVRTQELNHASVTWRWVTSRWYLHHRCLARSSSSDSLSRHFCYAEIAVIKCIVINKDQTWHSQGCGVDKFLATPAPTPTRKYRLRLRIRLRFDSGQAKGIPPLT